MRKWHNIHYRYIQDVTVANMLWLVDIFLWTIHSELYNRACIINHINCQYSSAYFGAYDSRIWDTVGIWRDTHWICDSVCLYRDDCVYWPAGGQFGRTSIFEAGLMDECTCVCARETAVVYNTGFKWWLCRLIERCASFAGSWWYHLPGLNYAYGAVSRAQRPNIFHSSEYVLGVAYTAMLTLYRAVWVFSPSVRPLYVTTRFGCGIRTAMWPGTRCDPLRDVTLYAMWPSTAQCGGSARPALLSHHTCGIVGCDGMASEWGMMLTISGACSDWDSSFREVQLCSVHVDVAILPYIWAKSIDWSIMILYVCYYARTQAICFKCVIRWSVLWHI